MHRCNGVSADQRVRGEARQFLDGGRYEEEAILPIKPEDDVGRVLGKKAVARLLVSLCGLRPCLVGNVEKRADETDDLAIGSLLDLGT